MSIVALDPPDFRTISDFRKRHLGELGELFAQVLQLCDKAGLVKLGHVAFDGSKMKANASKHKAMSYGRMEARARELEDEVKMARSRRGGRRRRRQALRLRQAGRRVAGMSDCCERSLLRLLTPGIRTTRKSSALQRFLPGVS